MSLDQTPVGTTPWRQLRDGSGGQVLCVDFDSTNRAEDTFDCLADRLSRGQRVWMATQDAVEPWTEGAADRYLARLAVIPADRIDIIVGYCSGAMLAAGLARVLRAKGLRVTTILVDPVLPTSLVLCEQYERAAAGLGASPVNGSLRLSESSDAAALQAMRDGLAARYRLDARRAASALGVSERMVDGLTMGFSVLLDYLLVCAEEHRVHGCAGDLILLSRDRVCPESVLGPVQTVEAAHATVLSAKEAALMVDTACGPC